MHIVVIQNHPLAIPATFTTVFAATPDLRVTEIRPYAGDALPDDLTDVDGILVLGGLQDSWDDETSPWLPDLLALYREAHDGEIPALGVCLGAQLLARAFGGAVYRRPAPEIAFAPMLMFPAAASDPLFKQLDQGQPFVTLHFDGFDLPVGATRLARSVDCATQAFRIGELWGVQFHPEVDAALLSSWIEAMPADVRAANAADLKAMTDGFRAQEAPTLDAMRRLTGAWLERCRTLRADRRHHARAAA